MSVKVMTIQEYVNVMSARQVPMLPTSPLHMDGDTGTGGLTKAFAIVGWEIGEIIPKDNNYRIGLCLVDMNGNSWPKKSDLVPGYVDLTPHNEEDKEEDDEEDEEDEDGGGYDGSPFNGDEYNDEYIFWVRENFDPNLRHPGLEEARKVIDGKVFVFWEDHMWSDVFTNSGYIPEDTKVRSIYLGFVWDNGPGANFVENAKELREKLGPLVGKLGEPRVYVDGDWSEYHDRG